MHLHFNLLRVCTGSWQLCPGPVISGVLLLVCLLKRLDSEKLKGLCMGHMRLVIFEFLVLVLSAIQSSRVVFTVLSTIVRASLITSARE